MIEITTKEELLKFLADADSFTMVIVKDNLMSRDFLYNFLEYVIPEKMDKMPPYSLLHDITLLLFSRDKTRFKSLEEYPSIIGRIYRNFLDSLFRYDNTLNKLYDSIELMSCIEKKIFLKYFMRILAENLSKYFKQKDFTIKISYFSKTRHLTELDYEYIFNGNGSPYYMNLLEKNLKNWFDNQVDNKIFDEEDLLVLDYYKYLNKNYPKLPEEKFDELVMLLKDYSRLSHDFLPYNRDMIKHIRNARQIILPLKKEKLFSSGDNSGICTGGNLEHFENIVPSEIAFMDDDSHKIDLFDINMIENRLLFFKRNKNHKLTKRRRFYVIFFNTGKMVHTSNFYKIRWSFIFLSVIFQLIKLYRDFFNLKDYFFQFVYDNYKKKDTDTEQIINFIADHDFPDINLNQVILNNISDIERCLNHDIKDSLNDYTFIIFLHNDDLNSFKMPLKYQNVNQIKVFFKGDEKDSRIILGINEKSKYEIKSSSDAMQKLIMLRNDLTLQLIS